MIQLILRPSWRTTALAAACVLAATAVGAAETVIETDTGIDQQAQQTVVDSASIGRSGNVETRLASEFSELLGGEEAAAEVVAGLRTGQAFNLGTDSADTPPPVTGVDGSVQPPAALPTGSMGYGNVRITLKLAEARLAQMGITEPTGEQLSAILLGGEIGGVPVEGILNERAAGAGWGEIAQRYDMKVGQLMGKGKAGVEPAAGQDSELLADETPVEPADQDTGAQQAAAGKATVANAKKPRVTAAAAKANGGKSAGQPTPDSARQANGYIPSGASSVKTAAHAGRGYASHGKGVSGARANGYIPSGPAGSHGAGIVTAGGAGVAVGSGKSDHAKGQTKSGLPNAVNTQGGGIVSAGNAAASTSVASVGGRGLAKGHAKGGKP